MKFIYLPLPLALNKLSADDFNQRVNLFLQTLKDAPRNVYVHCLEGRDRTGLMIALYRTCMQAWPLDEAYSEMVSCGYRGFAHHVILSAFKDKLYELGNRSA
jgi:protein tyrosine/serine phosphatase